MDANLLCLFCVPNVRTYAPGYKTLWDNDRKNKHGNEGNFWYRSSMAYDIRSHVRVR